MDLNMAPSPFKEDLTLYDICTKELVAIGVDATLKEAVALMYRHGLRDVIVEDGKNGCFAILTVSDIIRQQQRLTPESRLDEIELGRCLVESKDFFVKDIVAKYGVDFHYICLAEEGKLVGIVSRTDVIGNYDPQFLARYEKVVNLLGLQKINYISYDTPASDAIVLLQDDLDDALIVHKEGEPVGIVTARDVLRIFADDKPLDKPIGLYMSAPLQTLPEDATIQDAFDFLNKKHFKRAIVADAQNRIVGMVTQKELARLLHNKWLELTRESFGMAKKAAYLEELATKDPLTRAYNRTKFYEVIEMEEERIRRYGIEGYALVIVDIDDFKKVNDRFGHDVGDEVLKSFVCVATQRLRKNDMLFRWGGEEFVLFLPQTSCDNAAAAAEKIRKAVTEQTFEKAGRVTCSFGVAARKSEGESADAIIKRADTALYRAKREGKNRVERAC